MKRQEETTIGEIFEAIPAVIEKKVKQYREMLEQQAYLDVQWLKLPTGDIEAGYKEIFERWMGEK